MKRRKGQAWEEPFEPPSPPAASPSGEPGSSGAAALFSAEPRGAGAGATRPPFRDRQFLRQVPHYQFGPDPRDNFVVHLERDVARALSDSARRAWPNEAAGLLAGRLFQDGEGSYLVVSGAAQAEAEASAGHIRIDEQLVRPARQRLEAAHPTADVVGWWHSHIGHDRFSFTDEGEQRNWVLDHNIGVLVVVDGDRWGRVYRGPDARELHQPASGQAPSTLAPVPVPALASAPGLAPEMAPAPELTTATPALTPTGPAGPTGAAHHQAAGRSGAHSPGAGGPLPDGGRKWRLALPRLALRLKLPRPLVPAELLALAIALVVVLLLLRQVGLMESLGQRLDRLAPGAPAAAQGGAVQRPVFGWCAASSDGRSIRCAIPAIPQASGYRWVFGDGARVSGSQASHDFQGQAPLTAELWVRTSREWVSLGRVTVPAPASDSPAPSPGRAG